MNKDLFGKQQSRGRKPLLESALHKYDRDTFPDRLRRLKYIKKIFPGGYHFTNDQEGIYILDEAKMTYINGNLIATLLLSQAYIERRLQSILEAKGFVNEAKSGLESMIKHLKKHKLFDPYLLKKINQLRKKRNPFTHLKPNNYEFSLNQRLFTELKRFDKASPLEILEKDAKEAISLMYTVCVK